MDEESMADTFLEGYGLGLRTTLRFGVAALSKPQFVQQVRYAIDRAFKITVGG